ncbi:MAG: 2,3-bisphosphoglycerate-independent phosphoglycerate mutase [Spirochaetae bacterium HGW-Spirochaetae-10]|nr:MAG: 2,3-bisphosphoglycerate-independent phosphoglycerate mutase [Spirochaetae bacterium HGW-Spirochaetae-10]
MKLSLNRTGRSVSGPVVLVIMDGVGLYKGRAEGYPGNAVDLASAPFLKDQLQHAPIRLQLKAHGTAVGMPSDEDMGNSEVGHNALGAGRIFDQGAKLVAGAIASGQLFTGSAWMDLVGSRKNPGAAVKGATLHFIGLLSDGNVHSHIDHLIAMLRKAHEAGVRQVRLHILLDGRDVDETSALLYVDKLEAVLKELDATGKNYRIASGGGRMKVTMDRYEADWSMVELGWKTHVAGEGRQFASAKEAIETFRNEIPGVTDQDLPAFVIGESGASVGQIKDGDAVIFFNFRGDRAIEISRAFVESDFNVFERHPKVSVKYAGMMQYDGDLKMPPVFLVDPPAIDETLTEYLVAAGVKQYALSETQKFGHVTYFWNGNNSAKISEALETWEEIPSDVISFDRKPRMKADEIGAALVKAIESGEYGFLRVNFANGDMVGHTGILDAAVAAVEAVDQNLPRILEAVNKNGGILLVTADHGNCEQMYEVNKKTGEPLKNDKGGFASKTSHTLNPVPFLVLGNVDGLEASGVAGAGLANVAATVMTLLGFEPPAGYLPSVLRWK